MTYTKDFAPVAAKLLLVWKSQVAYSIDEFMPESPPTRTKLGMERIKFEVDIRGKVIALDLEPAFLSGIADPRTYVWSSSKLPPFFT